MRRGRVIGWTAAAGLVAPLMLGAVPAHAAGAAKPYDVNGDGRPDLVVGAPHLNRAGITAAGGIVVLPGGRTGSAKIITQSTANVAGGSEPYDYFGSAIASGDFDADGYADVAVGIPGEDRADNDNGEGSVTILYGTAKGLTGTRSKQVFEPSGAHKYAAFGTAVAAGDVNGDGYADVVVGAVDDETPSKPTVDFPPSGTVTVLLGGKSGIQTTGSRLLRGDRGSAWDYHFGSALAVADVDADGRQDVVVVSEGADEDGTAHAGSLSYCAGAAKTGPTSCRRLLHDRDLSNAGDVVVGNVQGDSRPEILVGVPVTDVDSDPGSVQVVRLAGTGPSTTGTATRFDQDDSGVPGTGEESGDYFGAGLALGNVDGDGYADLVVGAPGEAVNGEEAGRVVVVRGGGAGLATSGNTAYDQDTAGVPGGSERGDGFGAAVALSDTDGDGRADLVIGAPGEDDGNGRVTTLPGTGTGFTTAGARTLDVSGVDAGYDNRFEAGFGAVLGG